MSKVPTSALTFNMLVSQFLVYLPWINAHLALCPNSVLNVKVLVGAVNLEKALVGAFSVFVKLYVVFGNLV